jgi:RNase P subunit RPR2
MTRYSPAAKPGLRHEIPHRWEEMTSKTKKDKKKITCAVCPLPAVVTGDVKNGLVRGARGRHVVVKCLDCGCTVHRDCADAMPRWA